MVVGIKKLLILGINEHLIDHAILLSLRGDHPIIAIGISLNAFEGLTGVVGDDSIEFLLKFEDLSSGDLDIRGLTLDATHRLMDHNTRVRESEALALLAGYEEHGSHRSSHTGADGRHVGIDILHSVIYAKAGIYRSAGRVDIEADILIGVDRIEIEELSLNDVSALIGDLSAEEDDAVHHQSREDIHLSHIELALLEDIWVHIVGGRSCDSDMTIDGTLIRIERIGTHAKMIDGKIIKITFHIHSERD